MYEIDQKKFGTFVATLRKEKNLTQKELAEKLFISDKAVSKWERGLSMPDVSLLRPLADFLSVSITALLSGQHLDAQPLAVADVERLVSSAIGISSIEQSRRRLAKKMRVKQCFLGFTLVFLEILALLALGFSPETLVTELSVVLGICLSFSLWFCIFAEDTLPAFYDQNKISFYSNGIIHMNMAGIHFNNNNWPHIVKGAGLTTLGTAVAFPLIYAALFYLLPPAFLDTVRIYVQLAAAFTIFVPIYVLGNRYQ